MKKSLFLLTIAIMAITGFTVSSCADADEGESQSEWELRNTINGPEKRIYTIKDANGNWTDVYEAKIIYFSVKFSASNHNFTSKKAVFNEDGNLDEETQEVYTPSDNTAYTIKDNVIECTVDGKPYFRMTVKNVTNFIECELYFYNEDKAYEVTLG